MPLLITFPAISYEGTATNSGVKAQSLCPSVDFFTDIAKDVINLSKDCDGQPLIKNRPAN